MTRQESSRRIGARMCFGDRRRQWAHILSTNARNARRHSPEPKEKTAGDGRTVLHLGGRISGKTKAPGSCSSSRCFRRAVYPFEGAQRLPVIRPADLFQAHPMPTLLPLALVTHPYITSSLGWCSIASFPAGTPRFLR